MSTTIRKAILAANARALKAVLKASTTMHPTALPAPSTRWAAFNIGWRYVRDNGAPR